VESTLAEVLILDGLAEGGFYKVVTWEGLKILGDFEGLRGGDA
jgi:hypothetical protein